MSKIALITGITGQDGSYLVEFLLEKGYIVHGIRRRTSTFNTDRVDHIYEDPAYKEKRFFLHYGDMTDSSSLLRIVRTVDPDEIYNLAAQSHVAVSFEAPEFTADSDAVGTLRLLEAIRILYDDPTRAGSDTRRRPRFYQASTSELYGLVAESPQSETTPFHPRSPYGVAKLYAYWITVNYREAYDFFACNGILFNHESPRRGETFVTRKISRALASLVLGDQDCLYLGNLNSLRDWGHARDYVEAMWLMLQQDEPRDYVIATGRQYSIRDFVELSAAQYGLTIQWNGDGANETGTVIDYIEPTGGNWWGNGVDPSRLKGRQIIAVDEKYYRPSDVTTLLGNADKAHREMGWQPKITFEELVREMTVSDLFEQKEAKQERQSDSKTPH